MTQVPEVYSKILYKPPDKRPPADSSGFEVEMADRLLKKTGQYKAWGYLRQKNGDHAKKAAELILKRHDLVLRMEKGERIDEKLFDDLTEKLSEFKIRLYSSAEMKKTGGFHEGSGVEKTESGRKPDHSVELDSDEYIFELRHGRKILSDSIVSFRENSILYTPVKPLLNLFKFDYDFNDKILAAEKDGKKITFDFNSLAKSENGRKGIIKDKDFIVRNNEIFLSDELLSELFNSRFKADYSKMVLFIETDSNFFDEDRNVLSDKRIYRGIDKTEGFTKLPQKYSMADFPVVDFQGNLRHESDKDKNALFDYSITARGELLKSGYKVFVKGDEEDNPERADILFERINPVKSSPLEVTRAAVFDVRHDNFKMLGSTDTESGIRIESHDLQKSRDFDTTEFDGNLPPGSEIELYRNNVLIARTTAGRDGRYIFDDVSVFYGQNVFRLVWEDPQGRKSVEERIVNIGSDMQKKGTFEYDFTLTAKDKDTVSVEDRVRDEDYESPRFTGNFSFGAFKNLNVDAGMRSEEFNSERHNYFGAGFKTSVSGMLVKGDAVFDEKGKSAESLLLQTNVKDLGLRLKNTYYNDLERENQGFNPEKNVFEASVSGTALKNSDLPVSFTLSEKYVKGEKSDSSFLSAGLGLVKNNFSLFNYNSWQKDNDQSVNEVDGYLYGYTELNDYDLKVQGDYTLHPSPSLDRLIFSADRDINDRINAGVEFENDFEDGVLRAKTSVHHDSGRFRVSPSFSADTEGEWEVRTDIAFSLSREPHLKKIDFDSDMRTNFGEISALLYEDENNNGKKDDKEPVISETGIGSVNSGRNALSGEDGVAVLKGLSPYRKEGISVNTSASEDPFLESKVKGVYFYPRPGRIEKTEIPFYRAGEVSGYIFTENENNEKKPLAYEKIVLESQDQNIKMEIMSDYDGFFVAEKIVPGEYTIEAGSGDRRISEKINIESSQSINRNIVIRETEKAAEKIEKSESEQVVLYENGRWIKGTAEQREPDKSVLLYENGRWVYGSGKLKGFGVHVASFKNLDYAKNLVKKILDEHGYRFVIKKFEHNGQIWNRVMCPGFESREKAREELRSLEKITGYAAVLQI
ncbi:MAG: SPOR domain-containing protein [Desulfobacteraceae bacterium]